MNATEVQAEIYRQAKNRGWDVRLEVACGVDHTWVGARRTKSCRFDVVLMKDGQMAAIVECKRGNDSSLWAGSRRRGRYAAHGVPVLFAGPEIIAEVIQHLAELLN